MDLQLELAGLTGHDTTKGSNWLVPDVVDVHGRILRYEFGRYSAPVHPEGDLLGEFVRLAVVPMPRLADAVVRFARRAGVLFATECEVDRAETVATLKGSDPVLPYGLRHDHSPEAREACRSRSDRFVARGWEDLAAWRRYSRQAAIVLRLAQEAPDVPARVSGRLATCLAPLLADASYFGPARDAVGRLDRRATISIVVDRWLRIGDVRPRFEFDERPEIRFGGDGLFGALAFQLVRSVARADGIAICVECGTPYVPSRRPSPGRENFCAACRAAGVHYKRSKQRSRAVRPEGDQG